jgi:hypothetical protein
MANALNRQKSQQKSKHFSNAREKVRHNQSVFMGSAVFKLGLNLGTIHSPSHTCQGVCCQSAASWEFCVVTFFFGFVLQHQQEPYIRLFYYKRSP